MVTKKTAAEIEILKTAGRLLSEVLDAVERAVAPGVSMMDLDRVAEKAIAERGATPAFKGYRPTSAYKPFPDTLCVAPNNIVVHGIPSQNNLVLQEGDIIGIDTGLIYQGLVVDSGRTVGVGNIDQAAQKLIDVTKEALAVGVSVARPGNTTGDIGYAIESYVKSQGKYGIVVELCGHGVGHAVHEEPQVPNFGRPGKGFTLAAGHVIAIEPMINEGGREVIFEDDGYTVRTRDGGRSAHFEHTVIITDDEPIAVTAATK